MTLSGFALWFEAGFAVLLLVTIVYAIKLNARMSDLRARDSELQEMIGQFHQASTQAQDSALALKSAGIEAEQRIRAAIDHAQALRDDLAFIVEHGERIADRIAYSPTRARFPDPASGAKMPAPSPEPAEAASDPRGEAADGDRPHRSEIERELAQVMRSTGTVG